MIGRIIKLALFLLVAHGLYQFVPVYLNYQQFKDDVRQTALFAGKSDESEVLQQVLKHARDRNVPLSAESVRVRRVNQDTLIDAAWVQNIKFVPGYTYPWEFRVSIGLGGR
jgi:hypothetical protein